MRPLFLLLFLLGTTHLLAQTEKRVALVVGNAKYPNNPLANPANDARDVAAALRTAGFTVTEKYDRSYDDLNNLITDFSRSITDPDAVALFYYAGHGVQYNNQNYLVPIDAEITDEDQINWKCVPLENVTNKMQNAGNRLNIIILDACRAFPVVRRSRALQTGLTNMETGSIPELIIAYATAPGSVADDRSEGKNGLFTSCLLRNLRIPGYDVHKVFLETRKEVAQRTNRKQVPGVSDFVTTDFYFLPALPGPITDTDGDGIPDTADKCPLQKGTLTYGGCPEPADKMDLVLVPGGTFNMGCTSEQQDCGDDEKPGHSVTVNDFYIGQYEVTQQQWRAVMGSNPPELVFKGCDMCPVERVSWDEVQDFIAKLNQQTGQQYRLPTEAEWEYAARGGGKAVLFGNGKNVIDPKEINFNARTDSKKSYSVVGEYRAKTIPVGSLHSPNALGLHDMSGNVWEWCGDWYAADYYENSPSSNPVGPTSGSYRVLRGGSLNDVPQGCRAALRSGLAPGVRSGNVGFRLARTK